MSSIERAVTFMFFIAMMLMTILFGMQKANSSELIVECYSTPYSIICRSDAREQRVITWREISSDERQSWQNRCKPTEWIDKYGVTRLKYAEKGCEYGP